MFEMRTMIQGDMGEAVEKKKIYLTAEIMR